MEKNVFFVKICSVVWKKVKICCVKKYGNKSKKY